MGIDKKKIVDIAIKEAKNYKSKLAGTVLLVVYKDRADNEMKYIEVEFQPHHYQHLTGILLTEYNKTGKRVVKEHTSMEFYRRCIGVPFITPQEIAFENENIVELKMTALPYITQITKITKMTGTYDKSSKNNLFCDYVLGGEKSCIGISKNTSKGAPLSAFKKAGSVYYQPYIFLFFISSLSFFIIS